MTGPWRRWNRRAAKITIFVILAATVCLSGRADPVWGDYPADDVTTNVRVSPVLADLRLVQSHVRVRDLVVAVATVSNISDHRVLVLRSNLRFDARALHQVLHVGSRTSVLRPRQRRTDLWLLRAKRPGKFVIVASMSVVTADLTTIQVDSGGELLEIRSR